jgi:hypothetical protein
MSPEAASTTGPVIPHFSSRSQPSTGNAATGQSADGGESGQSTKWVDYPVDVKSSKGYEIKGTISLGHAQRLSELGVDFSNCGSSAFQPQPSSLIIPVKYTLRNATPDGYEADAVLGLQMTYRADYQLIFAEQTDQGTFACKLANGIDNTVHRYKLQSGEQVSKSGYVAFQEYYSPSQPTGSSDADPTIEFRVGFFFAGKETIVKFEGPGAKRHNGNLDIHVRKAGLVNGG